MENELLNNIVFKSLIVIHFFSFHFILLFFFYFYSVSTWKRQNLFFIRHSFPSLLSLWPVFPSLGAAVLLWPGSFLPLRGGRNDVCAGVLHLPPEGVRLQATLPPPPGPQEPERQHLIALGCGDGTERRPSGDWTEESHDFGRCHTCKPKQSSGGFKGRGDGSFELQLDCGLARGSPLTSACRSRTNGTCSRSKKQWCTSSGACLTWSIWTST